MGPVGKRTATARSPTYQCCIASQVYYNRSGIPIELGGEVFSENMGKKSEPQVTVCLQGVNWTRTFKPDLVKLNMTHPDNDVAAPHEEKTVPDLQEGPYSYHPC
ncbi:hypothetical protein PVAP13_7NG237517 [Panicum virgatum]|uniref:Uncharacterized protein n=1 Tax=Panicum virgatum TaxID=38727 RepID=A0A8T0PWJ4_PANVG|nr:hypothetical protein PVAP13_7NG237517 [Panicum virgatum]